MAGGWDDVLDEDWNARTANSDSNNDADCVALSSTVFETETSVVSEAANMYVDERLPSSRGDCRLAFIKQLCRTRTTLTWMS